MAQPVPFRKFVPPDTRDDLARKIDEAPRDHAEALLSSLQLLQQLHDTGTLDLLRGAVGAGDAVVNHIVNIISTPEMVNGLRNLLTLSKVLANIDPDSLHNAIDGRPEDRNRKPPSLLSIGKQMNSEDARLGLATAMQLLTAFGGAIRKSRETASE